MDGAMLKALQVRTAMVPGGRDLEERPIIHIPVPQELQPTHKENLTVALKYILSIFSDRTRAGGFAVVVDAQRGQWRVARSCIRQVMEMLTDEELGSLIVLRPDAFWDKQRVENCTKTQKEGKAVYIPRSRLNKFVLLSQLPDELGGKYIYNHNKWIETRLKVEDFYKDVEDAVNDLNQLRQHLLDNRALRVSEIDRALNTSTDLNESTKVSVQTVMESGRELLQSIEHENRNRKLDSEFEAMSTSQDTLDTIEKIENSLENVRRKKLSIDEAWVKMEKSFVDAKDINVLEEGIARVTNWILGPAEILLNSQQKVGFDVASAEELRREHESLELQCWETYGQYAELIHKIDSFPKSDTFQRKDLISQRDFMDFVCRSFATRLERRRNVLITSLRFFRLVSEYFDRTSEVFELLVMGNKIQDFSTAGQKLKELQDSQNTLDAVERELKKEGEKLSDMLSMPVKDALGRDVAVDYEEDIVNIRDILDATTARKNIFSDSVELQKLTLEQVTHITTYEKDVRQAVQWIDELFGVMVKEHGYVGCNVGEIQCQKDEHQAFQETAKDTYNYGCQLLSASLSLRQACKLPLEDHSNLSHQIRSSWTRLLTVSQEQMTRLRVSAVFHRSVDDHCIQLSNLREQVESMPQEDVSKKRTRVRRFMVAREKLLVEVGRMVRLGRLLKTRLKEPLYCDETMSVTEVNGLDELNEGNATAVEAISDRLAEVTGLAEQLDMALRGAQEDCALSATTTANQVTPSINKIFDGTASTSEDWNATKNLSKSLDDDLTTNGDDDFVTASECTYTQSRSSSFNTVSECEKYCPWWEFEKGELNEDISKEKMVLAVGLPDLPPPKSVLKPSIEVPPGKIAHEVTETTHIKVQHCHTLGVSSFVLTSETVRDGKADGSTKKDDVKEVFKVDTREILVPIEFEDDQFMKELRESGDWIQLKILEVEPELTKLGETLQEALELQKAHDEVLLQLQNKQSPVEELLRQADHLISTQRPRAEVYSAMAESLGRAWKDVNQHLELRKQILDLNVLYWERADLFREKTKALEEACNDSMVPIEIEAVKTFLTNIHELRTGLLQALMGALQAGNQLLAKIKELGAEGTLDSRPERIRASVNKAISQVEKWLDDLHIKRQYLELSWQSRKTQLEQCLALAMLARDLRELEETVNERRNMLANTDHLGDSISSAELFLKEHQKLIPESRQLQERAIKITKATEQLVSSGCFAGEQATEQAYAVLADTSDYLSDLDNRESLLTRAIAFFKNAHQALTKLDQLEVELTTSNLPIHSPKLAQLHGKCAQEIEEIISSPVKEGYDLLSEAGRGKTGTDGIKMMVEELENRKIFLEGLCTAHKEENLRISQALVAFLERQNELYDWLINVAEAFLKRHQDMGHDLSTAKEFMTLHNQLLNDLQTKGNEINSLLLTLPPILEFLDDAQRHDVDSKVEAIHEHWLKLKNILEKRLDLAAVYVRFHTEANTVSKEMDDLEEELRSASKDIQDELVEKLEDRWSQLVPLYQQAKNTGLNFISQTSEVSEPYLDTKRACHCVESVLERLAGRQLTVTRNWQSFHTDLVEHKELIILLERNMTESIRTIDWATKLDAQLYPIITSISTSPKEVTVDLENKLNLVLTEIKRAQHEVEQRIKMTDSLIQRSTSVDEGAINIKNKLNELSQKLVNIITDYQVLLEVLIAYFKNLSELEKTIENVSRQYVNNILPSDLHEVETLVREHGASRQAILEMFKFAKTDCEQIIPRIKKQEPPMAADHDIERMLYVLNGCKEIWEINWINHNEVLEQHRQLAQFDFDLHQINESLDDLSRQLSGVKGQYGESSASAKSTSLAFAYFEKTIELLQQRIQVFVTSGENLLAQRHGESPHINRELNKLKHRWNDFQQQVRDTRKLIDLSIEYFQLVEEADEWFKEGSKLLVTIARKSTNVKTPEEATELLNEIAIFLKPGEERQNERIKKISEYAVQLFGIERSKEVTQVIIENREMLDSFTSIQNELNILTRNLRAAEEERERRRREQEEAERRKRAEEEAERIRHAQEEVERKRREAEEAERRRREEEEARIRREQEEAERKRSEERLRLLEIEKIRLEKEKIRLEEEKRRLEEEERLSLQREEADRLRREEEERRRLAEEEKLRREREEAERRMREEEERLRREREEAERQRREYEEMRKREQEEAERRRREQEEADRLRREQEEADRKKRQQEEEERKRRQAEEEERKRLEQEEADRKRKELEEAERKKREAQEAERLRIQKEEAERMKKVQEENLAKLAAERARIEEAERKRSEEHLRMLEIDKIRIEQEKILLLEEKMRLEEKERLCLQREEADRLRREEEERRRLAEEEKLRREREEAEQRMREEQERLRREREEAERQRREDEERRKREQEEAERRRREQEEADRLRREQDEADRKKRQQEEEERKRREAEEEERKRLQQEEADRKRNELQEAERKKREAQEAERLRIQKEEAERMKKAQEENLAKLAAERARIEEEKLRLEAEKVKLLQEAISFKEHVEKIHTVHVQAVPVPEKSEVEIVEIIEELPQPKPPVFVEPLTDAVIEEGSRFTFRCQVDGFPMPVVTWHKDGMSIQNNPDYQTTFDNGICTLSIEETFAEDSARYTCKAINAAGTAETGAVLSVKETEPEEQLTPPTFTKILEPGIAKEGTSFVFECKVEGNPLPTVQWFKNYENIDNSPDFSITYNNGEAVLKFEEVFLEDKAEYTCKASNELGMSQCTASLSVEPLEPTTAPEFIVPVSNVMARAGQKIKLECQVAGLPPPQITWNHNGKPVKESRDLKLQYDENKATLVITEAFPKDAGTYVVTATNIAGEATSACNVSVKGRLPTETSDSELASDMEPIKPSIQLPLKDISVFEGKKVRLDCVIVGQPEPEVIWYHDERPVKESSDFQLLFQGDRCSLVIQEAFTEDAGEYKVIAINSAGEASSKCLLKITPVRDAEPIRTEEEILLSGTPPKFSKLLSDVLVSEGEKIILECCVTGEPTPDIKWALNNHEICESEHIKLSHSDDIVKLEIEKVTPDDKGVYTVKASNYCGDAKCFAQLIVKSLRTTEAVVYEEEKFAPSFKELFADRTCFENQTTKFECIITGKPTPKVKWLYNGEPVSGKDYLVSTSGDRQVLAIPEVSLSNQGKFTCVAENEVGKASCEAHLSVQPIALVTLPEMEKFDHTDQSYSMKREVFVSSSSSSKFISSSSAEPQISVKSMTTQDHKSFKQINQEAPEIIESHKIEKFEQKNKEPPVISEKSVTTVISGKEEGTKFIIHKPTRKSTAPRFVTPVVGKIVDQGVDVVLEGILDGYPTPDVTWSKNGNTIIPNDSIQISWELNHAKLTIKNVSVKDAGKYTCTAVNEAGSAISTTDLVVKKTIFPPVFGRRLQAQVVKKGDRLIMEVEVTGTPEPTITWHKDDQPIESVLHAGYRSKTQGNCHTLIVDKATIEHTGKYMVRAINSGGEAQSIADIAIFEPTPDTMMEVVKTVVFEDVEKQEIVKKPSVPTHKPVMVDIPVTILPETHKESVLITQEPKPQEPLITSHIVSSSEFSNITESRTMETKKFVLEHQTQLPTFEKYEPKPIELPKEPIVHEVPVEVEKKDIEDTGIETTSITKKSSLDFFQSKMKETEELPPPKVAEVQKISTDIFQKFETPVIEKYETIKHQTEVREQYVPPPFMAQEKYIPPPFMAEEYKTTSAQQQIFEEFNLTPEPPPEIGFIPKCEVPKKKEIPERIKKIEETQKDLSPFEVPLGAVKIFPTQQSTRIEDSHYVKQDVKIEKSYQSFTPEPVLRPQADLITRPLSPRPSAEGVEMEKLWTPRPVTPEYKPVSPIPQSQTATLEKMWTPHKTEYTEHSYTKYEEKKASSGVIEPSLQGKTMEKMWAHKHVDSAQKVWPPPQEEEQKTQKIHIEKLPEVHKTTEVKVEKHWAPIQTKFETSSYKESSDVITVPGPIYYVSDTRLTEIANVVDTSISTTERTEIKSEMRNENIIEESIRPSEIIRSWPPGPPCDLRAPQMVRETVPKIDTLPIRPVSVQDITDEIYLEPGTPPEIAFAEAPRERRQSYVESIEQDLEKNLEKEPSRVLPGSVRTIPPPRAGSLPPPLPPKKEVYIAPPLPTKPIKFEKPFEQFPELEPFPFKPDATKTKGARPPPPPTPSKFIKGRFADSDYESDFEAVRIPVKWKPCQSDNEEPTYRKVRPPRLTAGTRSRSTEPEPLPPSKFDHPPVTYGPPRPTLDLEATKKELKKEFTSQQIKQIKKETKQVQKIQVRKAPSPPPKLKPGSPPQFICAEPKPKSPGSPKAKPKFVESGYMADTDEPFMQKTRTEHEIKTEIKHFSQSSESYQRSHSMFESHSLPHPTKAFHKHEHKKQTTSTALKKELVAPIVSVTNQRTVRQEDYFKAEPSKPKRGKLPPPPSPSKFVKGEFKESDYESDIEGRIPPVWTPSEVDGDRSYKPVRPLLTPSGRHSISSTGIRTPTPPTEFDQPPQIEYPPRPKFEPIEKPKQPIKLDEILKTSTKPQIVFKPKPLPAKPVQSMEMIVATPARQEYILKPGSPPEIAYAPGKTQYYQSVTSTPYQNATSTETSNIMHFNESTEKSHRVVSVQQTTRVIKFGEQKEKQEKVLEPFPFKPEPIRPSRSSGPPPPKPKKFVPGDFKESDYESEVDRAHIKAKWKPGENGDQPTYRRVCPPSPSPTRSASVPVTRGHVVTPMEFDTGPPVMEVKRYEDTKSVSKASKLASKHMEDMTHTFKSTTQKFVNDIMTDMKTQPKQAKPEADDPQAYREESRVAEYGTKHIDPDTGLIYFKYDFGYEFGVILPGEGKHGEIPQPKKTVIQPPKRSSDIELPVYHETTNKSKARPNKKSPPTKNVKWEPTSESEMSEIEGDLKKRQTLHPEYRWEQASASPVSLSPSLPSCSPAFNSFLTGNSGKNQRKGNESPPSTPSTPGSFQPGHQNSIPKKAPMFITPLRDIAVVSGQTARFECIVQSEPSPSILWSKNGRIIENSQDYQIQFRNGVCRLSIPQAYPEDAGTYTCTATNQVGVVNTSATLQVPGVPSHMYGTYRQMHTGPTCSGYFINNSPPDLGSYLIEAYKLGLLRF